MTNKIESMAEEIKKDHVPKKDAIPGVRGPQVNPQDAELSSGGPTPTNWSRLGSGTDASETPKS